MKNKKVTTFLLFVAVAALWGIIAVRVASYGPDEEPLQQRPKPQQEVRPEKEFALLLDYRDPFLEKSAPRPKVQMQHTERVDNTEPQEPLQPPDMRFNGTVKQQQRLYALISAGRPAELLGIGDTLGGYRITGIWADSVTVKKGKHTYVLK